MSVKNICQCGLCQAHAELPEDVRQERERQEALLDARLLELETRGQRVTRWRLFTPFFGDELTRRN